MEIHKNGCLAGCQVEIMAAAFGSGMIHQPDLALAQLQYEIHVYP